MPDQRAQDAGVGDQRNRRQIERLLKIQRKRLQLGNRFAPGRHKMQDVGRPGVERGAVDIVPRATLPFTKIDLAQALVNAGARIEGLRQDASATQRAGNDRRAGRDLRPQAERDRLRIFAVDIQPPIADSAADDRARMADQENLHSKPP